MKDCRGADKGAIFLAAVCLHRASPSQHQPKLKALSPVPLFSHRGGGSGRQNVTTVAEMSNQTPARESWNFYFTRVENLPPPPIPFPFRYFRARGAAFVVTLKDNKQIEGVSGEETEGGGGKQL